MFNEQTSNGLFVSCNAKSTLLETGTSELFPNDTKTFFKTTMKCY